MIWEAAVACVPPEQLHAPVCQHWESYLVSWLSRPTLSRSVKALWVQSAKQLHISRKLAKASSSNWSSKRRASSSSAASAPTRDVVVMSMFLLHQALMRPIHAGKMP